MSAGSLHHIGRFVPALEAGVFPAAFRTAPAVRRAAPNPRVDLRARVPWAEVHPLAQRAGTQYHGVGARYSTVDLRVDLLVRRGEWRSEVLFWGLDALTTRAPGGL